MPKNKLPSLREMEAFAKKSQKRIKALKEPHDFCSIRWEFSAYTNNSKNEFELNWGLDNRVLTYRNWKDLTTYVEMMLEKRENARSRT